MKNNFLLKYAVLKQYIISILLITSISSVCFVFAEIIGNKVVALLLLVTVSLLAMLYDILPVLIAALLSALIWNYFFIPPLFTFHIHSAEDLLMFFIFFAIAFVNAVLTFKIRKEEKKARDKEEKEKTIKLYNTLINSLSHELRTPIATIIGAIDTLKENKEKLSDTNKDDLLTEIEKASIRLNQQVENLLNMNRLETGLLKLHLDWCDVNDLIFSVIQKIPLSETQHKITFDFVENTPLIKIDEGLMEQVIYNILHNAILYTPNGSNVKVYYNINEDLCSISIEDDGQGIPESEIKNLFNKFYRLPQTKTGGTGLGLSIAKGFVNAHGGKIFVENLKPNGCKFLIQIPSKLSYVNHLKND